MAIPSELISLEHFMSKTTFNPDPEMFESKSYDNLNHGKQFLEEVPSALRTKKNLRLSVKAAGLSIVPIKSPVFFGEFFTPASGRSNRDQPNSAVLLKSGCKIFEDEEKTKYLECYEQAEKFLDERGFKIVEPGAENKVRNYVKVIKRSQSAFELDSPLYTGSPSLLEIGDSSLLARRSNPRTPSPLVVSKDVAEDSPMDVNKYNNSNLTSGMPLKISKFGESSKKMSADPEILEEEKCMLTNEEDPLENLCKNIDLIYFQKSTTIQEVLEPLTPSFDLGGFRESA